MGSCIHGSVTIQRVEVHERLNVRSIDAATLGTFSLVVADLSFISLRTVLDALLEVSRPGADLVLLVKPQFEAGRVEASRGRGVISDPAVWRRALEDVGDALTGRGAAIMGWMVSPLRGAQGNVEFFVHARGPGGAPARRLRVRASRTCWRRRSIHDHRDARGPQPA